MNLNSWDFHEIEKEMQDLNVAGLLELYKKEEEKLTEKCVEYLKSSGLLTEERKKGIEKECKFLDGCKNKIALRIVDTLTK